VFFNSVINPSADIAHGFNGTALKLKDEVEIHGIVISDGDPVVIQSAAGVIQTVPRNRIASRGGLGRSLMMSADQLGVQPQDLADIHAYLRTK
jgi:putative heme-binding domain-containing protein